MLRCGCSPYDSRASCVAEVVVSGLDQISFAVIPLYSLHRRGFPATLVERRHGFVTSREMQVRRAALVHPQVGRADALRLLAGDTAADA